MVDNEQVSVPKRSVSLWYFVVPIIVGLIFVFVLVVINYNSPGHKLFDGVLWVFLVLAISGLVSGIIFWVSAGVRKPVAEREFFGDAFCHDLVCQRMLTRHSVKVDSFSDVSDSHAFPGWYGAEPRQKIFSELVRTRDIPPQYLLVAVNMEKKDNVDLVDVGFVQTPMNFTGEKLERLRRDLCESMCPVVERKQIIERERTDAMFGRSERERTESPMVDEDDLED